MGAILLGRSQDRRSRRTFRLFRTGDDPAHPAARVLPAYVVALRVGLGLGWMFVVAAELMGASED